MTFAKRVAGFPRLLLSAALAASLLAGCSKPAPAPVKPGPPKDAEAWVKYLTLDEKVGQLFWVGLPGTTVTPEAEQLVKAGKVGGFILFARQGSDPTTLRTLTDKLQATAQSRDRFTPGLVISIDQEGGLVTRFTAPFTVWPGNMAIGATGSEANAEQVYRAIAQEMRAVGLNMDLAPVSDVNNNPANPVIGLRSFGENPQQVAKLVAAAVKGLQSEQVSAVAKHFPGHGDTDVDSHKALPLVKHPMDRLEQVELVPFKSAIGAGIDAVMTAHVIFPAVEPDGLPSTLSPKVLTGLLKEKLGFKGVVVTDAMDTMKAITDNYGVEKGLVMAINAGADAVLLTDSFDKQGALHDMVVQAVRDGKIPESRIDDAVRRQISLKQKRLLLPGAQAAPRPAADAIGSAEHQRLANQVGADALTLVRNKHLPLKLSSADQLFVIGPAALVDGIKAEHGNVVSLELGTKPAPDAIDKARAAARQARAIIYGVSNADVYSQHQAFIKELVATGKPVVVIGMGQPYDLAKLPEVQTYVATYGSQPPNLQGVGALLFGKAPPKGRLPVSIPGLYPAGHGLSY